MIGVNGRRAMGGLKVGFFLTDLLEPNMGSLMVVPGSRRIQGRPPSMPQARYPNRCGRTQTESG